LRAMTAMCLLAGAVSGLSGQSGLATDKQVAANPATASQILSSYEGQNVTAIEVAGRPQSAVSEFEPLPSEAGRTVFNRQSEWHACGAEVQWQGQGCACAGGCGGERGSCSVHIGAGGLLWDL